MSDNAPGHNAAAFSELRARFGAYFDDVPDLRTGPEREADDIAELRLRIDNLVDALAYETRARQALEQRVKTLEASSSVYAELLQVYRLERGI